MTVELTLLLWSLAIYALYLGAQSLIYRAHYGVMHAASARDDDAAPSVLLGRAERALKNFLETYPALIVLLVVAHLAHPGAALVWWGALLWFAARIVYLPLYLGGVFMVRSLVWTVSLAGLVLMFLGILF